MVNHDYVDDNDKFNDIPELECIPDVQPTTNTQTPPNMTDAHNRYATNPNELLNNHHLADNDDDDDTLPPPLDNTSTHYSLDNTINHHSVLSKKTTHRKPAIDIEETYHDYYDLLSQLKIEDQPRAEDDAKKKSKVNSRNNIRKRTNYHVQMGASQTSLRSFFLLKPDHHRTTTTTPTPATSSSLNQTHTSSVVEASPPGSQQQVSQEPSVLLDITNDEMTIVTSYQQKNHSNPNDNKRITHTCHASTSIHPTTDADENHQDESSRKPTKSKTNQSTNINNNRCPQPTSHDSIHHSTTHVEAVDENTMTHVSTDVSIATTAVPAPTPAISSSSYPPSSLSHSPPPQLQQVIIHPSELFDDIYHPHQHTSNDGSNEEKPHNRKKEEVLLQLNHHGKVITQDDNPYLNIEVDSDDETSVTTAREYWQYLDATYFKTIERNDIEKLAMYINQTYESILENELQVSEEDQVYTRIGGTSESKGLEQELDSVAVGIVHDDDTCENDSGIADDLEHERVASRDDDEDDDDEDDVCEDENPIGSMTSISELLTLLKQQTHTNQQIAHQLHTLAINERRYELLVGRQSYAHYLYEKQFTVYQTQLQKMMQTSSSSSGEDGVNEEVHPYNSDDQQAHKGMKTKKLKRPKHHHTSTATIDVNTLTSPLQSYHDAVTEDYIVYLKKQRKLKKKQVKLAEDEEGEGKAKKSYTGYMNRVQQSCSGGSNGSSNSSHHLVISKEHLLSGEVVCHLCGTDDPDIDNSVLFCDRCDLAVHQVCYGVSHIPEGDLPWYCDVCTLQLQLSQLTGILPQGYESYPCCIVCQQRGGAMKMTEKYAIQMKLQSVIDGFYQNTHTLTPTAQVSRILQPYLPAHNHSFLSIEWCHLICAIYLPETYIGDPLKMTPVCGIQRIASGRYNLRCTICKQAKGQSACIQCCTGKCTTSFHASCARDASYQMEFTEHEGEQQYVAYCERHRTVPRDKWLCCFDNSNQENVNNPYLQFTAKPLKVKVVRKLEGTLTKPQQQKHKGKQQRKTTSTAKHRLEKNPLRALAKQLYIAGDSQQHLLDCSVCSFGYQEKKITSVKNLLIQCSHCRIRVHQLCYGVVSSQEVLQCIQKKHWLCDVCSVHGQKSHPDAVKCAMCQTTGGAMKMTDQGGYCHITCALFIPELSFVNVDTMTPITGVERALKNRWTLKCECCSQVCHGQTAAIQCSYTRCMNAFHVPCAERSNTHVLVEHVSSSSSNHKTSQGSDFIGYCTLHSGSKQALAYVATQRESEAKRIERIGVKTNLRNEARQVYGPYTASMKQKVYTLNDIQRDTRVSENANAEKIRLKVCEKNVSTKQVTLYYINEHFNDTSSDEDDDTLDEDVMMIDLDEGEDEDGNQSQPYNLVLPLKCNGIHKNANDDGAELSSNKKRRNLNTKNHKGKGGKASVDKNSTGTVKSNKKKNTIQQYMMQQARHEEDGGSSSSSTDDEDDEEANKLYCLCRKRYIPGINMICCDRCEEWYHEFCVGVVAADYGEQDPWFCNSCDPAAATKKQQEQRKYRR